MDWEKLPGALTYVSCASRDVIWGVNRAQEIWHWNGHDWNKKDGRAIQISVGVDGTVWCVNSSYEAFYRDGPHGQWNKAPGSLVVVSCYDSRSVVGVNSAGEIWSWSGSNWNRAHNGNLRHISVGSSCNSIVWGVNSSNEVFKHEG
jgi:hypothetical protein